MIWNASCLVYLYPLEVWGFCYPCHISANDYEFSHELSRPLVDLILLQYDSLPCDAYIDSQFLIFKQLSQARHRGQVDAAQSVLAHSSSTLLQAIAYCRSGQGGFVMAFCSSTGTVWVRPSQE